MNLDEIRKLAEETRAENHAYAHFLQKIVKFYDLDIVLECGTGGGGSSMSLAKGNDHVLVITIDKHLHPITHAHLHKNYSNIVIIEGDTRQVDRQVKEILSGRTIDLLFIDSTHDGVTPREEFDIYSKYFSEEVLVMADDISLSRSMIEFWANIPGQKADFLYLHPQHNAGFGVSIIRHE